MTPLFERSFSAAAGILVVVVVSGALGAQSALEPGLWRITTSSTSTGIPEPDQDVEVCLEEELQDIAAYFTPELEGVPAECERTRQPTDGRELAYRLACRGDGFTIDIQSSVTIDTSRHFTLRIRTDTRTPQESAIVTTEGDAHWIGACQ